MSQPPSAEHMLAFDDEGRMIVQGQQLADRLRPLLERGSLDIVLAPAVGPMEAKRCNVPPGPVPPVGDCGDVTYHLKVKSQAPPSDGPGQ